MSPGPPDNPGPPPTPPTPPVVPGPPEHAKGAVEERQCPLLMRPRHDQDCPVCRGSQAIRVYRMPEHLRRERAPRPVPSGRP